MTAEFIVKQTGEQLVSKIDDLQQMLDTFEEALYSNDPAANYRGESRPASHHSSQGENSELGKERPILSAQSDPILNQSENDNNCVMYEESILKTLIGDQFRDYISMETGKWTNEEKVVEKFQELFEGKIRCIFDAN